MTGRRILVDGFFLGKPSGFGRFISELCWALYSTECDFTFVVAAPDDVDISLLPTGPRFHYQQVARANLPIWEQVRIPLCAARHKCDIIHFPFNSRAIFTGKARSVTTVHDLTFLNAAAERSFKGAFHNIYVKQVFKMASVRSDTVLSVSNATKNSLLAYGVDSRCIYNTVDKFLSTPPLPLPNPARRPYLLHRGSYALGHRNTQRIIQAFLSTAALYENFDLKILGTPEGAERWKVGADQPVQFLKRISDGELASLYKESSGVVAASLLEGFCLPILEGFGFGVPVIASNIDPMAEISGDAALFVNPFDVEDVSQAMVKLLSDKELARDLVRRGYLRLKHFSAATMAEKLIGAYNELAA